jgi:hypothetical protein
LAGISESKATVFLGRLPISKKLEMALYLAKMVGPDMAKIHTRLFSAGFSECLKIRNAVAHGVLLGENERGELSFLTADTGEPQGEAAMQLVISFSADYLAKQALRAEGFIPVLEQGLKLEALRGTRLERPLSPRRKGQNQQHGSRKPHTPPQSSEA